MFTQLGRFTEALPIQREAVAIYRELAADPDDYRPGLANSLNSLGVSLAMLGSSDAIPLLEEAVAIYRELAAADSDRFRPSLAHSLRNLGAGFGELGRPADALQQNWTGTRTAQT